MIKELRSFRSDPIMLLLVAYSFTIAIYAAATGASTEATNLQLQSSMKTIPIYPVALRMASPRRLSSRSYSLQGGGNRPDNEFATCPLRHRVPPKFEADILAGRQPTVQIDVDATAAAQAFNGMTYIQNVINDYVTQFITGREGGIGVLDKMVTQGKVQSEFEVELVHLGDADHQQSHHDHRDAHRRCAHSRARAGYG